MYENGHQFTDDGTLLKFRVSDHDAYCGNSWSHEEVILRYIPGTGYIIADNDNDIESEDIAFIAKKIVEMFMVYFDKKNRNSFENI